MEPAGIRTVSMQNIFSQLSYFLGTGSFAGSEAEAVKEVWRSTGFLLLLQGQSGFRVKLHLLYVINLMVESLQGCDVVEGNVGQHTSC